MLVMNGTEISYSAKVVCQLLAREHVVKKKKLKETILIHQALYISYFKIPMGSREKLKVY